MLISVYGTSNKPYLWRKMYEGIVKGNHIDCEFIFSGPEKPVDWDLPSNFKWLKTNVKPMQGQQASYLECQGEYIMCVADDTTSASWLDGKGFLDVLYEKLIEEMESQGHDKIVMAPKFKDRGRTFGQPFIRSGDCRGPNLSLISAIMKKSFMDDIGGFDKRFIAPYGHIDVAMEMWARGGYLGKTRHAVVNEIDYGENRICQNVMNHDRPLVNSLWMRPPHPEEEVPGEKAYGYYQTPTIVLSKERNEPWQHFEKEGILEHSQGDMLDGFGWD